MARTIEAPNFITLTGTGSGETLTGTEDADLLDGQGGDDILNGLGGNDSLIGGIGNDQMNGGLGDDTFYVADTGDQVFENAGEGNDRIAASVSYALAGSASVETIEALTQGDTSGLNFTGNAFAQTIIGNNGVNVLDGGGGNDVLAGLAGNDVLIGGAGNDLMYGGTGNDTYYVQDSGDQVFESSGEGNDRIAASVSFALPTGSEVETIEAITQTATDSLNFSGSELAQTIIGNNGANVLNGGGGNDVLISLGGNDTLIGGSGIDQMYGGIGNDTYYVEDAGDQVFENIGEGNDRVAASVNFALAAGSEVETIEALAQSGAESLNFTGNEFAQTMIGNAGANVLDGGGGNDLLVGLGGNDTLLGGSGNDQMYGGLGNDTYYVQDAGDQVFESVGQGNDRIAASTSFTLAAGSEVELIEAITTTAFDPFNFTGNEFAQTIYGNVGDNILSGGGGNDVLNGFGGNDILIGGTGADSMTGGLGDDTYYVDNPNDFVFEVAFGGQGVDRIATSVSYALYGPSEVETIEAITLSATDPIDITGSSSDNRIIGNNGENVLNGGGDGNDTLIGAGGADTFAFTFFLQNSNIDTIVDFSVGTDKVLLGGAAGQPFEALATGTVAASSFVIGTAALDADDYIIYNSVTGALLYDADGNGIGTAQQFATLSTGLALTAGDFIVSGAASSAPTVTSGSAASIAENSASTTIVYQATAADADGDRITWVLGGTDAGYLTIDAASGAVRLINPADFETKTSYAFTVVASDSGSSGTAKAVTLTVTDVADSTSTPNISETNTANDGIGAAQSIDRNGFNVSTNADLPNQALPSATIHGSISGNNDVDYYSITLQAGEQIVLDVDHTTNSLDSFIRFFGPTGNEIASNDDKVSGDTGSNPPFDHNTDSYLTFRATTSGTYYFSIESFGDLNNDGEDDGPNVGESSGNYSLNVSIGPPATAAQIMDEDIDALISGSKWDHTALTYGFPTSASQYPNTFKEVTPATDFSPFTAAQQGATVQLLQLVSNVSSLTFQQLNANPGSANIRYAMSSEAGVAYAYYPTNGGPNSIGGTAWFNKDDFNDPIRGNYSWMGILHETGHALGLKHGHEAPAVSFDHDSVEYTVMTYRSYPGDDLSGYMNERWGYPQTLMMLDIAALQRIYGANYSTNSDASVYTWSPTTGEMSINGVGQGAANNGAGGSANRIFMTVWDGGGNDTYDLSNYGTSVTVDLRPGEWSTMSSIQLANLDRGTHLARGNVANALLYQGNVASLIEDAKGGSAGDILIANQVANHLTGNGGADTFKWMAATDVGTGALADTIMDFIRGTDKIDLSNIDAIPTTAAVDQFHFIGTGIFTNHAGELRYDVIGGSAHVYGDLDGNGSADFEIIVNNVGTLAATDFNGANGTGATAPGDIAANGVSDMTTVPPGGFTPPPSSGFNGVGAGPADLVAELSASPLHLAGVHNLHALVGPEFYY